MKIENWAIIKTNGNNETLVLPEDFEPGKYRIIGNVFERNGFQDGALVATSTILSYDGVVAKTRSGSVYELGKMDEDYLKFIEAYKKGIKILKSWDVERGFLSGYVFEKGIYENFPLQTKISGEVISQDLENNICVIETKNGQEKVFVDWLDIGFDTLMYLQLFGSREVLKNILMFGPKQIKLDLLGKHKRVLSRSCF